MDVNHYYTAFHFPLRTDQDHLPLLEANCDVQVMESLECQQ